jgi:HD-GYP domain-containing protein (c-di-GMP phosphodiesterase class II)
MSIKYSPIVLDSIIPKDFPKVELYVRHDKGFTLYKPQDTELTEENLERLRESGTEFVYINSADGDLVQAYIEKNLDKILSSEAVPQLSKNLIFSHVVIDCINEVFKNPKKAAAFRKCRTILKRFSFKFEDREELTNFFSKLERNYEKYLVTHTTQVTILSMFLYEKLFKVARNEVIEVGVGAMLHDIGMLQIASNITEKTDALSETEYHRVKLHPRYGYDTLCEVWMTERIPLDIALSHHERHDGSGYPRGLSDQSIPRHAMLVSICDIYCALTMNRPYRSASTPEEALKTLKSEKKYFDPAIFEGFLGIMIPPHLTETLTEEKSVPREFVVSSNNASVDEFTKKLRSSTGDRKKLLKLHSEVTDRINDAYGEEKEALIAFKGELRNFLKSLAAAEDSQN